MAMLSAMIALLVFGVSFMARLHFVWSGKFMRARRFSRGARDGAGLQRQGAYMVQVLVVIGAHPRHHVGLRVIGMVPVNPSSAATHDLAAHQALHSAGLERGTQRFAGRDPVGMPRAIFADSDTVELAAAGRLGPRPDVRTIPLSVPLAVLALAAAGWFRICLVSLAAARVIADLAIRLSTATAF
jgi:hypothetical protein